jgi:hypothetical protein
MLVTFRFYHSPRSGGESGTTYLEQVGGFDLIFNGEVDSPQDFYNEDYYGVGNSGKKIFSLQDFSIMKKMVLLGPTGGTISGICVRRFPRQDFSNEDCGGRENFVNSVEKKFASKFFRCRLLRSCGFG